MQRQLFILLVFTPLFRTAGYGQEVYKQSNTPIEARVTDLLSRMNTEEKIHQLNQYIWGLNTNANNTGETVEDVPPGIGSYIYFNDDATLRNQAQRRGMGKSRLGIPILFGFDVIHGFRTIYPIPLAQACSWNPELVHQACTMAAHESHMSGVDWTSPMIGVARDGRWGRVAEGYGEDPYTNAVFCVAAVRGYQGDNLSIPYQVAASLRSRYKSWSGYHDTFPYSTGQIPIYYNARQSSHPDQEQYQDISTRPLYNFGHGLSYAEYTYGELKVSSTHIRKKDKFVVEIPVANAGKMDGYETHHWFISDPNYSISRPLKELKHFEKSLLKTRLTSIFRFEIDPEQHFSYVDYEGNGFTEVGDYYIIVKDKKKKVELTD